MSLEELYQDIIVDHGKSPRNSGVLSAATHQKVGHNPLCGDKLVLYLIVQDDVIQDARFEGVGCAISVASASLMIETIKGKTTQAVATLFSQFHLLVTEGKAPNQALGKLLAFSGVYHFPIRVKCATLAWHTLNVALEENSRRKQRSEVSE
ncbi:MAG: hypothetical protein ACD_45C00502G0003 [uncultured bacterium]|nr:MAG: hypothetical protein ACD_45C00502G0003 [uncultured bacterium]OGT55301.1 MAG: SUF system NifU family Fe-S cluster assembly protein [Gammaproteobacteria bacterium RIFCSPHIGHO2_12_FULL_42_10]